MIESPSWIRERLLVKHRIVRKRDNSLRLSADMGSLGWSQVMHASTPKSFIGRSGSPSGRAQLVEEYGAEMIDTKTLINHSARYPASLDSGKGSERAYW